MGRFALKLINFRKNISFKFAVMICCFACTVGEGDLIFSTECVKTVLQAMRVRVAYNCTLQQCQ